MAVIDAGFELDEQLPQRRVQGVIDGFRANVGPRRHEVRAYEKCRARFQPAFDENAGLVDLERRPE